MGVVYRAHDPVIGRDVAVKTMHLAPDGASASRPEFLSRFQTEARAAGILTHPNIVVVYDAGEEAGVFYITMELVEGRSLQSLLDEHQSFPLPRAIKIIEQASSALDYAHRHNIIHRDVKPANLMITADDTVKITDFGTAKILRFNTTQTAAVIGTPSYMSPEQIKGKTVDGRSDIFALGVILYELVTGEKPFPGQNITTVIYKIVNEEPIPPRELDPSINSGLCNVIARALAKDPTARFQTCAELLDALKNYRNFEQALQEDLHAAYLPPPSPSKLVLKGGMPLASHARPASNIMLPDIARAVPVPSAGHTVYTPQAERPKKSGWSTFWFSLLLLGVIGASGYFVRPYTGDVWAVVRSVFTKQAAPVDASTSPATATTPAAVTSPAASAPAAPVKSKPAKIVPTVPASTQPDSNGTASSADKVLPADKPIEKSKTVNSGDAPAKVADSAAAGSASTSGAVSDTPLQRPAQTPAPAEPQLPLRVRMARLKANLEQKLSDTGFGDRVHVTIAGNTLILEGHLRPGEHQALLNKLRFLPDWAKVTDDILPTP